MTFGADGLAAGLVLLLVLAALALLFVVGLATLFAARLRREPSRGVRRAGLAMTLTPVAVVVAAFVWARASGPPSTLRLDLRGRDRPVEQLHVDEFPGFHGFWQVDSHHVDIRVPHGVRLQGDTENVVFTDKGGQIDSLEVHGPAESPPAAARRAAAWAKQLHVSTAGLDRHARRATPWKVRRAVGATTFQVDVQSVADGESAIAYARIGFTDSRG